MGVRQATLNQTISLFKSTVVILLVLTKNFMPQKLGRNKKEPLCHTIKRLHWVLSFNIFLWISVSLQILYFTQLYKDDAKTFAYIVLAMPLIYVCICTLLSHKNCFSQNQQTKIRFFILSGLFLVFKISTLMFHCKVYFLDKFQNWTVLFSSAVLASMNLYVAAIFAKMAFISSLKLSDMYNLDKISSLDKTCGASNVLVFLSVLMGIAVASNHFATNSVL